jgi:D-glycero-alpha-D-manno-heptose 1-phosphate guanylyltransferase
LSTTPTGLIPLILAGGRGTRIAHLHPDLPKPAVSVAGKPFLAWILAQLAKAEFRQAVVSSGYRSTELCRQVEPFIPAGMEIRWVAEEAPLGTGGGSAWAAKQSGWRPETWLVMNGDSYLAGTWPRKISCMQGAALVAREVSDTGRFGRLEERAAKLVRFSEKTGGGVGLINAGIYRIPSSWFDVLEDGSRASMETDLFPAWLQEGKEVTVVRETGAFLDIGTPESLASANEFARLHLIG